MYIHSLKKQRGSTLNAKHISVCADKLIDISTNYIIKTPMLQKIISLDKSKQDLLMHSVLAGAGGAMVLAASAAVASSGVTIGDTAEYINHISYFFHEAASPSELYDALGNAIEEGKSRAPAPFKEVWGTMSTGALNCARNLTQIWFLRSGVNGGLDLSTSENRQMRRKKQSFSNFISGTTNIPQLLEGLSLHNPTRIIAAGSAVSAYFLRAKNYDKSYHTHAPDNVPTHHKHTNKNTPGNLMIARGMGQTALSVELLQQFGLASGAFILLAGLGQTFGAVVMKFSDKKYIADDKAKSLEIM